MNCARILVVDDKENMLKLIGRILEPAYAVTYASDGQQAFRQILGSPFDLVITDIKMPGPDGYEVFRAVKQQSPDTEVILMTAYASIQKAVEAIREGAYDYIQKPFDPDELLLTVERALERKRLRVEAADLRKQLHELVRFDQLVGNSEAMKQVFRLIEQASRLDITVLISGESGTGKELVARAIHGRSARKDKVIVPVNCGALPADLVESELFGHVRGAFTGATSAQKGLFEEADGGTLFLDEIGDLPLPAQVKLTRVLQEKEIRRVGEARPQKIDVRVIAATHRDLREEVRQKRFRDDLFYRLNVFPIFLPPLRARLEDIPLLAAHFVEKLAAYYKREISGLEPEALRALVRYPWPGNVRELENVIERAVALSETERIDVSALPLEVCQGLTNDLTGRERLDGFSGRGSLDVFSGRGPANSGLDGYSEHPSGGGPVDGFSGELLAQLSFRDAMDAVRERASYDYLVALMREVQGNVTRGAERAGMERESLHRLLRRHGLRSEDFKGEVP